MTEPLSQRYSKHYQKNQQETDLEKIRATSLEELSKEVITFGKAHLGSPFPTAFDDHSWTDYILKRFEKSLKPEHVRYITFVEKKLDAEAGKGTSKGSETTAKEKTLQKKDLEKWEKVKQENFSESDEELWEPTAKIRVECLTDQVHTMQGDQQMMHQRLGQMENALQELITHVKNLQLPK